MNKLQLLKIMLLVVMILLEGCVQVGLKPAPTQTAALSLDIEGLSKEEATTLSSLEKLDDYPLYTMRYEGDYSQSISVAPPPLLPEIARWVVPDTCTENWGCSLFAALGDPASRLYGRNFDWRFSPALLLFTDPPDGFASVSMVDIEYLGFTGDQAKHLLDLSLSERQALLATPGLPFDGMNDQGLAVGMAAVPPGEMQSDPGKASIGELGVIRQILDHASTVSEALDILASYNIDMQEVPLHYLVASSSGESALVEFYQGKMVVMHNTDPWQLATNFLVASTAGHPQGECPRYDRISQKLHETGGKLNSQASLSLLADVSQNPPQAQSLTQWSIVYDMSSGEIHVIMGRAYDAGAHTLQLTLAGR